MQKIKALLDSALTNMPFENSISQFEETIYPGDWDIEEKIRHFIRWNALVTVLKANKDLDLGGHISTYSSAATLMRLALITFSRWKAFRYGLFSRPFFTRHICKIIFRGIYIREAIR